jgi:hypothetical protein
MGRSVRRSQLVRCLSRRALPIPAALGLMALGAVVVIPATSPITTASATTPTWTATEVPPGATTSVSCSAADSCTSVGSDSAETLSSGTWNSATVPFPSDPSLQSGVLNGVSCYSAGCVAAGYVTNSSGDSVPWFGTLSGTTWTSTEGPLPANAAPYSGVTAGNAHGISCPTQTSCVAVGEYSPGRADTAFIDTLSNGTWTAMEAPYPSNASLADDAAVLYGVTCQSVTSCVAVGYYDAAGYLQGLIETLSNGSWTPMEAPVPSNASTSNAQTILYGASCPGTGSCVAVGYYDDTNSHPESLIETLAGGTWAPNEAPEPSNDNTSLPGDNLQGVSCSALGSCIAVGSYFDPNYNAQGLIETLSSGTWTPMEAIYPSDDDTTTGDASLTGVSCPLSTACVAVGNYPKSSPQASLGFVNEGLVDTLGTGTGSPLTITTTSLPNGTLGQSYTTTLQATGGTAPYTWTIATGSLPPGLSVSSSTGVISGIPTTAGTYAFTAQVTDATSPTPETATAPLSITLYLPPTLCPPSSAPITRYATDGSTVPDGPPPGGSLFDGLYRLGRGMNRSNPTTGPKNGPGPFAALGGVYAKTLVCDPRVDGPNSGNTSAWVMLQQFGAAQDHWQVGWEWYASGSAANPAVLVEISRNNGTYADCDNPTTALSSFDMTCYTTPCSQTSSSRCLPTLEVGYFAYFTVTYDPTAREFAAYVNVENPVTGKFEGPKEVAKVPDPSGSGRWVPNQANIAGEVHYINAQMAGTPSRPEQFLDAHVYTDGVWQSFDGHQDYDGQPVFFTTWNYGCVLGLLFCKTVDTSQWFGIQTPDGTTLNIWDKNAN